MTFFYMILQIINILVSSCQEVLTRCGQNIYKKAEIFMNNFYANEWGKVKITNRIALQNLSRNKNSN